MMHAEETDGELKACFELQRAAFAKQSYPALHERRACLLRLERALLTREASIAAAISADFGHRPATETRMLEMFPSLAAIRHARAALPTWMKADRRKVSSWFRPARASIRYQPLGVVGIVVPWNYPLYLSVGPLVGALAAGNRVLIKLSEYTPNFGQEFASLIAASFPADLIRIVLGDVQVGREFCRLPFDHILFTGSTAVGRDVMASAARNLTPVTLELGGKSPALLAPNFDLDAAARRIAFGKLVNAGQTCIAPDYVLAPGRDLPALVDKLRAAARSMYVNAASPDYTSIAHDHHYQRLGAMLEDARAHGARCEPLLDLPPTKLPRRFAPVAILDPQPSMRVLREEIFGPLLPIVGYDSLDEAIACINAGPRPLALYLFDGDPHRRDAVVRRTHSGGVTINDTLLHAAQEDLPFGGVGQSGMGRYHGIEGFRTFSQVRSVYEPGRLALTTLMYPPYGRRWPTRLLNLMIGKTSREEPRKNTQNL